MSFCKDCVSGVRLDGTPEGKFEKIAGYDCYIATPTIDYPKDAVILLLTDAFGIELSNNQLLADDFAKNGFKVVAVDLFNGDPVDPDALSPGAPSFDFAAWGSKHGRETVEPQVTAVTRHLEEQGVSRFALTGYCFGGRVAFDHAFGGKATVVAVSHPSLLKAPEDLEKYKSMSKAPLLINSCEIDTMFPAESQIKADEILGEFAPGYKRTYWEGCTHGFAVRGDMSDPKIRAGKEGAFKETVLWFLKHL